MTLIDTFFNADVAGAVIPALLRGLLNTLALGLLAICLGIPAGILISLLRLYAPRPVRWLTIGFIDIFRAVPLLVVLILIYFALPFVGIRLSGWASATLAFTLVMSAYSAEVFRGGIESIPSGQFEAAHALGLSFVVTLRKVVLPQAVKLVIPPMTSNCVSMFKDTSLASVVALPELLKEANDAQAFYANPTPLIGAALIYLAVLWPMVRMVNYVEARSKRSAGR